MMPFIMQHFESPPLFSVFPQYVNTKTRSFFNKSGGVLKHKLTATNLRLLNLTTVTVTVTAALRGVGLPQYD